MNATTLVPAVLFYRAGGELLHYETRTDPAACSGVAEAADALRRGRPAMVAAEDRADVERAVRGEGVGE